jgi:hypothetical protein
MKQLYGMIMEHLLKSKTTRISFNYLIYSIFRILKNIIIQLACRLQLQECIDKVTSLWNEAYPVLYDGMTNHS